MTAQQSNDPLHGKTLKAILTEMQELHGWEGLGERIRIKCFIEDPSIKSSLTFLRKTPWARTKLEHLYLRSRRTPWAAQLNFRSPVPLVELEVDPLKAPKRRTATLPKDQDKNPRNRSAASLVF